MKVKQATIYKCDYCSKWYQIKRFCERHEKLCKGNPDNDRPCYSCRHLIKEIGCVCDERGCLNCKIENYGGSLEFLFCEKKDIFLYPPQCEIKGNIVQCIDNYPMPKECKIKSMNYYD